MATGATVFAGAGVSIRRPTPRAPRASVSQSAYLCFPTNAESTTPDAPPSALDDDEALAVFQELAFQYAMEQTRSAVRAILLNVNKRCYSDAHRFFQRHMRRLSADHSRAASASRPTTASTHSLVPFRSLMKIPAAAIVCGSDATFSDVWMAPLFHAIHRSFPAILLLRDTIADGRQMVEWIMEQLDEYTAHLKKEEAWLSKQIEARLVHAQRGANGQKGAPTVASSLQPTRRLRERAGRAPTKNGVTQTPQNEGADSSDDEYYVAEEGDSSSTDPSDDDETNGANRNRNKRGAKRKRRGKASARPVKYSTLLLEDLLLQLREKMRIVERRTDPTVSVMGVLRDLILEDLDAKLSCCDSDVALSIKRYENCIEYVKRLVVAYRQIRLPQSEIRVASVEFSLATVMFRVMSEFASFLAKCTTKSTSEAELVQRKRREIEILRLRHEDTYHLHQFDVSEYEHVAGNFDPYLLICIEQLDRFDLRALSEFVDLWGNFATLHPEDGAHQVRLGFIFGVTTTTSQTLRHLGLSIQRRLDIQFYPLQDSKTRSEDILETLFVHNHFPLCLRGETLRLLDERHLTSQSLTAFMQVLEFVALSHFQEMPWSFLSHFALDLHHQKPMHVVAFLSPALRRWLERRKYRGRSIREYLSCFSDEYARTLFGNTKLGSAAAKSTEVAIAQLEQELARFREKRREWIVGWKCFRATLSWFNLVKKEEGFVEYLVLALDGRLVESSKAEWIFMMIDMRPIDLLKHMMQDWAAHTATMHDPTLHRELLDLIMIADHMLETYHEEETTRMRPSFRADIARFFRKRVLRLMDIEEPPPNSLRALVSRWSFAASNPSSTTPHVVLRLHEDVLASLTVLDDDAYIGGTAAGDLSLVFLHYRDHAGLQLNVSDWFDSFAGAVLEEAESAGDMEALARINERELNARFARALTTMRLWGYIKGPDAVRGVGRRYGYQDMRVQKCIFI